MPNVNIAPQPGTDGIPYCTAVPLTAQEADLGDGLLTPKPIAVVEGQTIMAVVLLTVNGSIVNSNAYVVMQTNVGTFANPQWVDVAWLVNAGTNLVGTFVYVLCGGGLGAMNNAFQQTRQSGGFPTPQTQGSNACPLGGQVRFVGKALAALGSSSIAGTQAGLQATITYRLQMPR